jgi:subtilisin family serine protease
VPEQPRVFVPPDSAPPGPAVMPPPIDRHPAVPPALARLRGWMPLSATGVPAFLAAHPTWDGRGVLLGILDSGLDAGVPGFDSTTTGLPKVLDLRDFSTEGRIALTPVTPSGDTVVVAGRRLVGFGRVRGIAGNGPWYGGALFERRLGEMPAADANDNGTDSDTLAVVVARASDGWVLFADTDGDGSLADEHPVHDYLTARETFGWHRGGEPPPLTMAANLRGGAGVPELALFFDNSGHGTHVAGIAAARGIGGVAGFDGVAPGAQVLALKIARNDFGGITTTGSVMAALDYAFRFAAERGLPLVINMSFGVGNEREGAARLDAMLDSALAGHPGVTFVTSAGNDGPGLSTMGFPGSLRRGVTVGATQPAAFSGIVGGPGRPAGDVLLFFSSRGGELAKPDLIAPGVAYSTVPRWNMGDELKLGTSMSSPHVAGLAALLVSGLVQERREVRGEDVRRALTAGSRPFAGETALDEGAGEPDAEAAWRILRGPAPAVTFDVEALDRPGTSAGFKIAPSAGDSLVRFRLTRRGGAGQPVDLTLTSDVPWLVAPPRLTVDGPSATVALVQHPPLDSAGLHVGTVRGVVQGIEGPVVKLVSSVVIPAAARPAPVRAVARLAPGTVKRVVFAADSGRPFRVRLATGAPAQKLIAALHQPGGAPILGDNGIPGGADTMAAVFDVDGRDALQGYYEAVAVAPPTGGITASIGVDPAPVALRLTAARGDSLAATLTGVGDSLAPGRFNIGLIGGEDGFELSGEGGADVAAELPLPAWASRLVIDLRLTPEEWERFSDFGFTVLDAAGRILGKNPLNYAHGRLTIDLPRRTADGKATLVLSPGFTEPGSRERWTGRVTVRLEAGRPVALETAGGDEFRLARGAAAEFRARVGESPWSLPPGFTPLALFIAESRGVTWSWELPLGPAWPAR